MSDTGNGSLRKAIAEANSNPGLDSIKFNIPPAGPKSIIPLSKLPNIVDPVIIDGTTQPGFVDKPIIEINCSGIGAFDAFDVFAPGTTIRGLVLNRKTVGGTCIVLWAGSDGSVVEGNFFGTDLTGTIRVGNVYNAIISESSNNRIGGTAVGARNVFAGHGNPAVALVAGANNNVVQGNLFGTNVSGTVRLGNTQDGIIITFGARDATIGGTTTAARNIISGSGFSGIAIVGTGADSTQGHRILGNYIGTNITGTADFGSSLAGIYVKDSPKNIIGGSAPGAGNIISGNDDHGVFLDLSGTTNTLCRATLSVRGSLDKRALGTVVMGFW